MWDWLIWFGRSIFGGALGAVGGFIAGWGIQQYRIRRIRKQLQLMREQRAQAQAVLIVSNRENIEGSVRQYLQQQNLEQLPVHSVHRQEPFPESEKEWMKFLDEAKREVRRLREQCSPSQILLFTNVPAAMAVFLGAILDNGPEVVVHHYFNGVYHPIGYLAHETVKLTSSS